MHLLLAPCLLSLVAAPLPPARAGTPQEGAGREDGGAAVEDPAEAAVRAIREGRLEEARELLDALLTARYLDEAAGLFAADAPQDGLLRVDRALELSPDDPEGLLLRAEGSLLLAEVAVRDGATALFVEGAFQDALEAFREVPPTPGLGPRVLFGASRAAVMLGRGEEALSYARRGMELVSDGPEETGLRTPPERTWAEASFLAYREVRGAEDGDPAEAAALFRETEDALARLVARTPDDPWVWTQIARLYQWEGDFLRAVEALQKGLDHLPTEATLLATLVEIAAAGAPATAPETELDAYLERHPDSAAGHWHRGLVRFESALQGLLDGAGDVDAFQRAEADLRRARGLDAGYASAALGYEAMCRNGVGWCRFNAGELDAATAAFRSMEELFPGGMQWSIEGRLLSGVRGLEFVAGAHNEAGDWARAADVFEMLREYQPEEVKWANNAGFFQRDAAVQLELLARALCARSRGEELGGPGLAVVEGRFPELPAVEASAALAAEALAEARTRMRASYDAYLAAAALAPEDVRIVNDTALIAVYYLREDLERAEEMLLACTRLGAEQLESEDLDEDARWELENAWGDAFQNLGVLHLALREDGAAARPYFERCVEIGPDPRPFVEQRLLPLCDADPATVRASGIDGLRPWGVDCD